MKKQTAVEWLFLMINNPNDNQEMALKCLEKAKQMEKEQIEEAWLNGMKGEMIAPLSINNYRPEAEDYYNETYGGTK
jgi:hypothetical protein